MKTQIKTSEEIEAMRKSGQILATVLQELTQAAKPGVKTIELDSMAREITQKMGGTPAFLGYNQFPAAICISINNEIVHGIPSQKTISEGDIVGLDYGVTYQGMITDSAVTIPIGDVSKEAARLLKGTKLALDRAINVVKDGVRVGDIGEAVEKSINADNLAVIYTLGGHGVGHKIHEEPFIPNFGTSGTGQTLRAGMTIAVEPNVSISAHDCYLADDNWTYLTDDGSLSAQFEHTILITPTGSEILTSL